MSADEAKARQRAKAKRERVEYKKQVSKEMDLFFLLRQRCQGQLDAALEAINKLDIAFEDFSSKEWDCRKCPKFMACTLADNFSENTKWHFTWLTTMKQEQEAKKNAKREAEKSQDEGAV